MHGGVSLARECPQGHKVKDRKALRCPQCGEELPPVQKRKTWIWVVGVLGLLVLGSILTTDKPDEPASSEVAQVAGSTKVAAGTKPTRTLRPTKTPLPTATPKPIEALTYLEIRDARKAMTDAQWKAYCEPLKGKRVEWSGYVHEAKESGSLLIDMDSVDDAYSIQDCYISVPKDTVLTYNLEQPVRWQGDIQSVVDILGSVQVRFENVLVLP